MNPGGYIDEARLRGPGVVRVQGFDGSLARTPATHATPVRYARDAAPARPAG